MDNIITYDISPLDTATAIDMKVLMDRFTITKKGEFKGEFMIFSRKYQSLLKSAKVKLKKEAKLKKEKVDLTETTIKLTYRGLPLVEYGE